MRRPEHRDTFAQIFRLYWRDPQFLEQMMSLMLPAVRGVQDERNARAAEGQRVRSIYPGGHSCGQKAGRPEAEHANLLPDRQSGMDISSARAGVHKP